MNVVTRVGKQCRPASRRATIVTKDLTIVGCIVALEVEVALAEFKFVNYWLVQAVKVKVGVFMFLSFCSYLCL